MLMFKEVAQLTYTRILGLMSNAATPAPNKSAAKFLRGRIRAVRAELRACQAVYDTGLVVHDSVLDRIKSTQMTALERDIADLEGKLAAVSR